MEMTIVHLSLRILFSVFVICTPLVSSQNLSIPIRSPDCNKILEGDQSEIKRAKEMIFMEARKSITDEDIIRSSADCSDYISRRVYPMVPASDEEAEYPIAYILTVHRASQQVENLLHTIYAPQNTYCIHIDTSSDARFIQAVEAVAKCFPNVFMVSKPVDIVYGGFSRLMADIHCMQDLLQTSQPWNYAVNICGQEMPLKTNLEIIHILKNLKGNNDIAGVKPEVDHIIRRFTLVHEEGVARPVTYHTWKQPPPGNVTIMVGSAYNMFTRDFVNYVIHDSLAVALLEWFRDTYTPDEHYWATLQYLKGTPGGRMKPGWGSKARAIKWKHLAPQNYPHCEGNYKRNVCVYGVGDLNWLTQHGAIIANKFDVDADHLAVDCLKLWVDSKRTQH